MTKFEDNIYDFFDIYRINPVTISITRDAFERTMKEIRADAIEEFAHILKETFNNEFPRNYHCTQPYFTLDNVRVLTDLVAKEQKNGK